MKTALLTAYLTLSTAFAWNPTNVVCAVDSSTVNVRTSPSINGKVAFQINIGEYVEIHERRNGWGRIYFRGNSMGSQHWVKLDFLCGYGDW